MAVTGIVKHTDTHLCILSFLNIFSHLSRPFRTTSPAWRRRRRPPSCTKPSQTTAETWSSATRVTPLGARRCSPAATRCSRWGTWSTTARTSTRSSCCTNATLASRSSRSEGGGRLWFGCARSVYIYRRRDAEKCQTALCVTYNKHIYCVYIYIQYIYIYIYIHLRGVLPNKHQSNFIILGQITTTVVNPCARSHFGLIHRI